MERNLVLAYEALDYVRKNIKPCNTRTRSLPGYESPRFNPEAKRADLDAIRYRARYSTLESKFMRRLNLGSLAVNSHIGNCGEMAAAAGYFLYFMRGYSNFDVVGMHDQDHGFVVIGAQKHPCYYYWFGYWPHNVAICDPWADIACLAREYPARWIARMRNWQNWGIHIRDGIKWLEAESCKNMLVDDPLVSRLF